MGTPADAVGAGEAITAAPAFVEGKVPKGTYRVIVASKADGAMITRKTKSGEEKYPFMVSIQVHIAKHLGMKMQTATSYKITTTSGGEEKDYEQFLRGAKHAKSIKVPRMEGTTVKTTANGNRMYFSIPVPSGATIKQIQTFLKEQCTANKPGYFISTGGLQYPVG